MAGPFREIGPSEVTPAFAALFQPTEPAGARLFGVLDGVRAGRILTIERERPTWGIVQEAADGSIYLGGSIDAALLREVIASLRQSGTVLAGLWPDDPRRALLPGEPDYVGTTYDFLHRRADGDRLAGLARGVPAGYHLQRIDPALLERCAWHDHLIAIFGTMGGFVAHGFGYCLMRGEEIVTEAYAGPATRGLMEIGIHTHSGYEGRGFATIASAQTIRTCEARGYQTYWNCATSNRASAALARKMGYQTEREYALVAWDRSPG